MNKGKVKI